MKSHDLLATMHAVLDGEATDEETRALKLRLAADPAARAEFEGLQRLFRALENVPMEHPPEGLVAAVSAALPMPTARNVRQLFPGSRVFGHASPKAAVPSPGNAAFEQPTRLTGITTGSNFMTEQTSKTIGNRKAWFGVGIAAAALLVVAQYGFDFPLGKDVTGTIVPAQRYRAEPNGSEAVKLAPAGTAAIQTPTSGMPLEPQATKQVQSQAEKQVQLQVEKQVQLQAEKQVQLQAEKQVQVQAEKQVQLQAEKQVQLQAEKQVQLQAEKQVQVQAERQVQLQAEKQVQLQAERQVQAQAEKQSKAQAEQQQR